MSRSRERLVARFRTGSLDRLRRAKLGLAELEAGRAGAELLEEVLGELHTMKGESKMLGLGEMCGLTHAVEERLGSACAGGARPAAHACDEVRAALDLLAQAMRGELGGDEAAGHALGAARERLEAATPVASPEDRGDVPSQPPPADATAGSATRAAAAPAERWAHVRAADIDDVCERIAELGPLLGKAHARLAEVASDQREGRVAGPAALAAALEDVERCRSRLEDLTSAAWALRLVPVEPAFEELLEHARDLAAALGKQVRVAIDAAGAELERGVLDALWEPMLHLVRNAIDHGIEPADERGDKGPIGVVTVSAESRGTHVVITIEDDGRGVDPARVRAEAIERRIASAEAARALADREALELLFQAGFSTRDVATEVSGRGLGLAVVRRKLEAIGGSVEISSVPGRSTRFELSVPSSLTKERTLVVACGGALYGLPSRSIASVVRLRAADAEVVPGGRVLRVDGQALPLRSLSASLGARDADGEELAAIVELGGRRWALALPAIVSETDLVRRPLDPILARTASLGASAILDDGRLVLLLRVADLLRGPGPAERGPSAPEGGAKRLHLVLVVDDSPIVRDLLSEILKSAGLEVDSAEDGAAAWAKIEAREPDLVLTDVEMPNVDGFELLRRIRARTQRLPVILVTTRGSVEDRRQATALGADAYLVKSDFEGRRLIETVRRFVDVAP